MIPQLSPVAYCNQYPHHYHHPHHSRQHQHHGKTVEGSSALEAGKSEFEFFPLLCVTLGDLLFCMLVSALIR